ncbi:MAG: glycoside hydrolase family 99-like domain-containing protein [Glaciimonas sp.]|nr:glycoside hydrolase family 99-like domain-containing protein [Glaciimonas sp.]
MKIITQAPHTKSSLARANAALRSNDFESAVALYDEALGHTQEPLRAQIRFNRELALQRMGKASSPQINVTEATGVLEKPNDLDQYYFDLIQHGNFFDSAWYMAQYKEKHNVTGNPLAHYLTRGVALSTNPSSHFDTAYYIKTYQDVAGSGMHPFVHYVCQGHKEDRQTKPPVQEDSLEVYQVAPPQYIPRLPLDAPQAVKPVRIIAFYLPQFHAIPENDEWWGKGFTEWSNVKPAQPQFAGHYQPHVPDDFLGYYNLLDRKTQSKQIALAKQYGVEGFCFYLYWFTGHRLLEQPVNNYLNDSSLDLPFCVCWANENWSRRWDGRDADLLIDQHYSDEDDLAFIANAAQYLRDQRYIRINGKPLLLIYRPNLFPNMRATAERWRQWCRHNGVGEIYLAYPQSFECVDPANYGFDAAIEFPPNNLSAPNVTGYVKPLNHDFSCNVYDWKALVDRSESYKKPDYPLFRGVCPSWDNTARRNSNGHIFLNSSPIDYQRWLVNASKDTQARLAKPDERLIFVNAWNEWAEGAHLEPDQRYGYAYLEATRMALIRTAPLAPAGSSALAVVVHAFYEDVFAEIMVRLGEVKGVAFKLFVTTPPAQAASTEKILRSSGFAYHLLPVENHGRDILPFLKIIKFVVDEDYAYILKVHTKKSKHRGDGDDWRNDLYTKLLNEESIHKAINGFESDANLGVIGPAGHIVSMDFYWGSNAATVMELAARLGQSATTVKSLSFVAGTMFYARVDALSPLLNLSINDDDFEREAGQVDGTFAHAIERAISISCKAKSYKIIDTDMNQLDNVSTNYNFAT